MKSEIHGLQNHFKSGVTYSYSYRKNTLRELKRRIENNKDKIVSAIQKDFGKPEYEVLASEIGPVLGELSNTLSKLKSWMRPKVKRSPLALFPSKSRIHQQPYGVVMIISPWNYPFYLSLMPLINAIAAGNVVVLKPSEYAENSSHLLVELFKDIQDVFVLEGHGEKVIPEAFETIRFDYIFFTGSGKVGKIIARSAIEKFIPYTLELGGKSPAIIDGTTPLNVTLDRLLWGKFVNGGQTCIAPDYLLVQEDAYEKVITQLKKKVAKWHSESGKEGYARMIHQGHFNRLKNLLAEVSPSQLQDWDEETLFAPITLVENPDMNAQLMREEIFGPILPVIKYTSFEDAVSIIEKNPRPLGLYVFSNNKKVQTFFSERFQFGGGCINNTLLHLGNQKLPFGGIGESGFGRYHGKSGFETFSHQKSVLKTANWFDLNLKYPPYSDLAKRLILRLLK